MTRCLENRVFSVTANRIGLKGTRREKITDVYQAERVVSPARPYSARPPKV